MKIIKLKICEKQNGKPVKNVLYEDLGLPRSVVTRAKQYDTGICLNGVRVFTNVRVNTGDELCIEIHEKTGGETFEPMEYDLSVLYEDEDLLVINKPAGMEMYAAKAQQSDCTIANAVTFYLGEGVSMHFVSRLDRGTSGIVMITKNGYMHSEFIKKFHTGDFRREYLAVVVGKLKEKKGNIELPIIRGKGIKREISKNGLYASTDYEVVYENDKYSLVKVAPKTGRTHQIRVHMAAIGNPLVGDFLYGTECDEINRPALHSSELIFKHSVTGKMLDIKCDMPDDMKKLI